MNPPKPILVTGKDGLRGTIEQADQPVLGSHDRVTVRLEDGREVMVPADALEMQDEGHYYLPLALADLEADSTHGYSETTTVPVVEETLNVRKRHVVRGGVRVHKAVRERQEVVDEPLFGEDVEVERVRVDRAIESPEAVHYEGDTMVIPLMEEVLIVEKHLVVREELRITKRQRETRDVREFTLRSEQATVDQLPGEIAGDEARRETE